MSACTQKTPNLRFCFLQRCLTNTTRRHHLPDGQLSSPYPPSPCSSSFGTASVMLCCFPHALSNTALPTLFYEKSIVFKALELHPLFFSVVRGADSLFHRPSSLPLSFLSSFVFSALPPFSFRASLPPPCVAFALLPFLPLSILHLPSIPAVRVELQSKQLVYHLHLIQV